MQGVYLVTDGSSGLVFAGFVAGLGWAHEQPQDRGFVEAVLRAIAWDPDGVEGVRTEVFVSAVTCSLVLSGSPESVEVACAGVARRLLGEQPVHEAPPTSPGAPEDADVLWRRWGARSYGLVGLTPYALPDPSSTGWAEPTRRLFNADTLVPFGVDTDVAALLEHLPAGPLPVTPPDEAILPLPAHIVTAEGTPTLSLSWVARPDELVADVVTANALGPCFARPTPEREAVAVLRRDLGAGGTHTTLRLVGRAPSPEEAAAVAAQVRRLRDEGPTETEIVQALDRLNPNPNEAPVAAALRMAWEQVTGVPPVPPQGWGDTAGSVREVLSRLLVVGPEMAALDEIALPTTSPVDSSRLAGRKFRTAKLVTDGQGLEGSRLIVGAEGLSWRRARRRETIRAEDVAVVEVWNDDDRSVLSRVGYRMHLDPLDWHGWDRIQPAVDSLAPDKVRSTGVRHPGITSAMPARRQVEFARIAPYYLVGVAVVCIGTALFGALNSEWPARDRLLTPLLMLTVGAFLCQNIWSIMTSVRRRQERARSSPPVHVPTGVGG